MTRYFLKNDNTASSFSNEEVLEDLGEFMSENKFVAEITKDEFDLFSISPQQPVDKEYIYINEATNQFLTSDNADLQIANYRLATEDEVVARNVKLAITELLQKCRQKHSLTSANCRVWINNVWYKPRNGIGESIALCTEYAPLDPQISLEVDGFYDQNDNPVRHTLSVANIKAIHITLIAHRKLITDNLSLVLSEIEALQTIDEIQSYSTDKQYYFEDNFYINY